MLFIVGLGSCFRFVVVLVFQFWPLLLILMSFISAVRENWRFDYYAFSVINTFVISLASITKLIYSAYE